jgi:hypothetical protein
MGGRPGTLGTNGCPGGVLGRRRPNRLPEYSGKIIFQWALSNRDGKTCGRAMYLWGELIGALAPVIGLSAGSLLLSDPATAAAAGVSLADLRRLVVDAGMLGSVADTCLLWDVFFFFLLAAGEGKDPG